MADFQTVLQAVDTLSEDEKQQLLKYLQRQQFEGQVPKITQRVLDLHPGVATMSDDFDEELPDSFWLDEE
jgi:hypothetical protein